MDDVLAVPIYIVDDDASVREAISYVLQGYGFRVETFDSGDGFLQQVPLDAPGCLVLDSRMPGLSGQQVHERLNQLDSCLEVMFLTSHGDLPMAVKAFRDGACDFHQKPIGAAELVPSIKRAQQGSLVRHRRYRYALQFAELTERERQLFELVVQGRINKQIAATLCISLRTVEVHRARMMERMGADSIAELVSIAEALKSS
ncbi:MAG: response regulator [Halopseudomonas sp.]